MGRGIPTVGKCSHPQRCGDFPSMSKQIAPLSVRRLRRMYESAQDHLQLGQLTLARNLFRQIADTPVKPTARQTAANITPANPLRTPAQLGFCHCLVEEGRLEEARREVETL